MRRGCVSGAAVVLLASCSATPPADIPDHEAASIYGDVIEAARQELHFGPAVPVHPYVAVLPDNLDRPTAELDEFEYTESGALANLQRTDSTLILCAYSARGVCAGASYMVLSQIKRTMERDASVVVLAVDTTAVPAFRHLLVELRYARGAWRIVDTQLAR